MASDEEMIRYALPREEAGCPLPNLVESWSWKPSTGERTLRAVGFSPAPCPPAKHIRRVTE
jgi:hypothetical protein